MLHAYLNKIYRPGNHHLKQQIKRTIVLRKNFVKLLKINMSIVLFK